MTERKAGPLLLRDWGGTGTPVLLAHGMAAHFGWWDPVVPLLGSGIHAAAFDFRGHGGSDWNEDGAYDPEHFVEDVETARLALGWDRFVLVGHSMGARIALEYAARRPDAVRAVAAVDFLVEGRPPRPEGRFKTTAASQPRYPDEETVSGRFRLQPPGTNLDAAALKALGRASARPHEGGWTWKFDWRALSLPFGPVWPRLGAVSAPALLVRGEHSAVMSKDELERATRALPKGSSLEVPGAHHHVPLDAPAETATFLRRFAEDAPR